MEVFSAAALAAGFLFLLNPCSFALLPSYLGVFLNISQDDAQRSVWHSISKAQVVSLMMSAGMLAVFLPVAFSFQGINAALGDARAWISIVLGIGLAVLGIALLSGFNLNIGLPKLKTGDTKTTFAGMFAYGATYAIAAMGCSLPILLVGLRAAPGASFGVQIGTALSFAGGMVAALITLTVAVATGASSVVGVFRKIMTHMNLITGIILIPAGLYLAYFGWWELDPINGPSLFGWQWGENGIGPIAIQQFIDGEVVTWMRTEVAGIGISRAALLGIIFLVLNVALATLGWLKRPNIEADVEGVKANVA